MTAPNRDDRLSQYFDGELTAEAAEVLRGELDDVDRAKLDGLEHLRGLLRAGAEEAASDLDGDALFASIEAKLGEEVEDDDPMFPEAAPDAPAGTAPARPKLAVVAGGKAEEPAPATPAPEEHGSRTGVWVGLAATALAAAAALLFWVTRPADTVDQIEDTDPTVEEGVPVAEAEPPHGSEVEEVDFGYSTGAIFSVEGNEGEQYAVVWISDEKIDTDGEPEERIQ